MTLAEVTRALRQLRVSGMAATLEPRIVEAQSGNWAPVDLISSLVQDELQRRYDRRFTSASGRSPNERRPDPPALGRVHRHEQRSPCPARGCRPSSSG
jgi:hypothetical protein